jgi:hypothetical protein
VAKNNRAFASFRALRETILRGKTIREFVVIFHQTFRRKENTELSYRAKDKMFLWNNIENIIIAPSPPCEHCVKPFSAAKKFRAFVANLFVGHKTNNGKKNHSHR